jgi:hypothetical protein
MPFIPEKIDPKVKERCVRQVLEHLPEHPFGDRCCRGRGPQGRAG